MKINGGAFTYGKQVDNLVVGLLCQSESSRSISRFLDTITIEFPIFLESSVIRIKKRPSEKLYRQLEKHIALNYQSTLE